MFIHTSLPFQLPDLSVVQQNGLRWYKTPEGNFYPSATTVIGIEEPQALRDWRTSLGPKKADKETKRAADRGTAVHKMIEEFLNNNSEPTSGHELENIKLFNQVKLKLRNINNIQTQETALWSDRLKIAGRVDCIAEYNGVLSIVDFKTSNNNKYNEMVDKYFIQTTAYALMYFERFNIPIEDSTVIVAVEKGMVPMVYSRKIDPYVPQLLKLINTFYEKYGEKHL
jgi:genome maintenance exonuclease 1